MGSHKAGECSVEQRCEEAFLHDNHNQSGSGRSKDPNDDS